MNLYEGLRLKDLQYLVSNNISVDEYTSKIDDDNITIAFFIGQKDAADELKDFIEKVYYIEIRDIEIAESMTKDNKYILFVEMERNLLFPDLLIDMIQTVDNVADNKKWTFTTIGSNDDIELNVENIKKYVRLDKLDAESENEKENQEIEEVLKNAGIYL